MKGKKYACLGPKSCFPVSPYLDPEKFSAEKREGDLNDFRFLPNTRLGMVLTELNRKRIYRKLSESVKFKNKQKEFLATLLDCPKATRKKTNIEKIKIELAKENREHLIRLGSDPDDWSMALEPNSVSFFDGILSGIWGNKSSYLREDLILEIMQNLATELGFEKDFGTHPFLLKAQHAFHARQSSLF